MGRVGLTTAGESHGPGLTAILTGLPAGLEIDLDFVRTELARRQHGYGRGRRMQIETDTVEFHGGVRGGVTLGSPIALWIANRDYENWSTVMDPLVNDPGAAERVDAAKASPASYEVASETQVA